MSTAQHQFFERVVLSVSQSRADLHEVAWTALGFLLVLGMLGLLALWWSLFHGGGNLSIPPSAGVHPSRPHQSDPRFGARNLLGRAT